MRLPLHSLAIWLAACASAASGDDAGSASAPAPSFADVYADVISRHCMPCHAPGGLFASMDLSNAGAAYRELTVNPPSSEGVCQSAGPRVIPGDCAHSLLYRKLRPEEPPCGSRMPLRDVPVNDDGIDEVCRWIQGGAHEY